MFPNPQEGNRVVSKARALWHDGTGQSSIREEELPPLDDGWCEIRTLFSSVSPGTESLVARGRVPREIHGEMACPYMGGEFPFPVKYGYSLVGEVVAGSPEWVGKTVHVLHPHQTRCRVRERDVHPIPLPVSPERATLASTMETAVNALWDSGVSVGDRVLVVGFGTVGSLVARLVSGIPGVQPTVVDADPRKVELARKMGFAAEDPLEAGDGFDLVFHASGTGDGLQTGIDRLGFEGTVVDLSWYGDGKVSLGLGGTFHAGRKTITSSQVSHVSARKRSLWDRDRRKDLVFSCLENAEYDAHLTSSVSFQDLPEVFKSLRDSPVRELSYLVTYGD
ncbi:MAG: zinc-binding alcohol dehydrogenase [Fidelibacterota bacterium]